MILNSLLVVIGLVLLTFGGNTLVSAALRLGEQLGISPLLCGLLIVGFGTSAPELAVSLDAVLRQLPDIAVGNVVGSNISNSLLILGLCALVAPLPVSALVLSRDASAVIAASLLLAALLSLQGAPLVLDRIQASLMLSAFAAYLVWAVRSERAAMLWAGVPQQVKRSSATASKAANLLLALIGLALLVAGSRMLVNGASGIAVFLGVPQVLIGLTLVAVGTSLPELVVSLIATWRGKTEVAVGNILGSNLFNALFILPAAALVEPLAISARIAGFDVWVMSGSAVLLMLFLFTARSLSRVEGGVLLAAYLVYIYAGQLLFGAQAS